MEVLHRQESEVVTQSYPVSDKKIENNTELLIYRRPKYEIQVQKLRWMTFAEYLESIEVDDGLLDLAKKKQSKICEFVYFFELTAHDPSDARNVQKWTIRRGYFDFIELTKKLNHELVNHLSVLPQLNKFYNNSKENPDEFSEAAEKFIQAILNCQEARNQSVILYEFIELSLLPLPSSPQRYKEGYMLKRGGGRFNHHKFNFIGDSLFKYWHKRWFVLTEEAIIYTIDSSSSVAREVFVFDQSFRIEYGSGGTGRNKGIAVITPNRILKLKTNNIFEALDWVDSIKKVAKASLYTKVHRFNSFAPIRELTNYCRSFVDSKGYFEELYECLIKAKKEVFITDWWLSPEIYLKFPVKEGNFEYRLDKVLGKIADSGVKVYIIVYHEVKLFMFNDSKYTKKALEHQSPNIRVLQHPHRHFFKWSNHGKMVVIDQCVGFLGGFDLSFGRLDDGSHPLVDPEFQEGKGEERFVGMEYSNVRIANFERKKVRNYDSSLIDKKTTPRLPWHDGMVQIIGPAVMDMSRHFIQFWNHVTIDVYKKKFEIPTIREHFNNEFYIYNDKENENMTNSGGGLKLSSQKSIGISDKEPIHLRSQLMLQKQDTLRLYVNFGNKELPGTCTCQMLRSGCNWSLGLDWKNKVYENSIQQAYIGVIQNAKNFIYIENQFFISSTAGDSIKNTITQAMVDRIAKAHEKGERFRIVIFLPLLHAFDGEIDTPKAMTIRIQLHWQFRTICRGGNSIYEQLEKRGIKPEEYIQFYSLRQHGKIMTGEPATEIIYIHSKILVADDDIVIIGSANINDRSMTGTHDSEIAMVIEDSKKINSRMNGQEVKVSEFASNFRRRLLGEHLGLTEKEVEDPLSIEFTTKMNEITQQNTNIYREIYACYPDDNIRRLEEVAIFKNQKDLTKYDELAPKIQGHIVWYPLKFLADETLEPPKRAPEHYVPEKTFI